jgi:hypothetical protein
VIFSIYNAYLEAIYIAHHKYPLKVMPMSLSEAFLWPGTKVCERLGVDPEGDAGLIRWMINTLVYLVIGLIAVWVIVV